MLRYSCDENVDTIEARIAPMMEPAMPIFAVKRKTVSADKPLAINCDHEMPSKKRLNPDSLLALLPLCF